MKNVKNNGRKPYVVKRYRLYTHLIELGYKELERRPDIYNSDYTVWIFENSDELYRDITEFYNTGY